MRLPKPDLMKPPDSQKAIAINHLQGQLSELCDPMGDTLKELQRALSDLYDTQHSEAVNYNLSGVSSRTYGISLAKALKA